MLISVDFILIDPPYSIRSGRKGDNAHYDFLNLEGMAGAVALCEQVLRLGVHDHLLCSALQLSQANKVLLSAREEEDRDIDSGEDNAPKTSGAKTKTVFDAERVHHTTSEKWRT